MNFQKGIKTLLFFTAMAVMFFACNFKACASDYQYKILDPQYNPSAEKLVNGGIPHIEEVKPISKKHHFDFGMFFAICGMVVFPLFIISLAVKTFKEVSEEIPGRRKQELGNIKIEPVKQVQGTGSKPRSVTAKKAIVGNKITPASAPVSPKGKIPNNAESSINKYFTSPLKALPNPMLLNTSPLSLNKGLCLVEYNHKYSLIGYINEEIFLLNQFDYLSSSEIRSRHSETVEDKDRYIIRLGEYKALVEVSEAHMNLLIEL